MTQKQYYLKATGSVTYDRSGITFPLIISIDFDELLNKCDATDIKWEEQYGWSNQPEVLTFWAEEVNIKQINKVLPVGLIGVEHWCYNDGAVI